MSMGNMTGIRNVGIRWKITKSKTWIPMKIACQNDQLNSMYPKAPLKDRKKKERQTYKQVTSPHWSK